MLDAEKLTVCLSAEGSMPVARSNWTDARTQPIASEPDILAAAIRSRLLETPATVVSFPIEWLAQSEADISSQLRNKAMNSVVSVGRLVIPNTVPAGYESLKDHVSEFLKSNLFFERNVFIMMRFRENPLFERIATAIRSALAEFGLVGVRADDRVYTEDLWGNTAIYMLGCKHGVAVFEDIEREGFNPNVPLEYGFMRALNKKVLLLKDKTLKTLPADVTGLLYRPFDSYDIESSIKTEVSAWIAQDLQIPRQLTANA
jgi:hypothetical protein